MIRLIIIVAIFYAGYQIGMNGYEDFISSINIQGIEKKLSNLFASIGNLISNFNS
jgi:hypothetical protein